MALSKTNSRIVLRPPTGFVTTVVWIAILAMVCVRSSFTQAPAATNPKHVLLIANQGDQTVSMIDPDAGREFARVRTHDNHAHEIAISPDGRYAYLPIYGTGGPGEPGTDGRTIELLDIEKRSIVRTIDLGSPTRPHCIKLGPDGMIYVSAELNNALDVVDPRQEKLKVSIPSGQSQSHMFAISHDGSRAYTANVGPGTVSVLDLIARKVLKIIPVAKTTQRISVSMDDRFVFTADQNEPRLAVIDTAKNEVRQWIPLPAVGFGTAPTPDGKRLLVTMPSANKVAVIDISQMKVVQTIDVAEEPVQIMFDPEHALAYVACSTAGKISVLDLTHWRVVGQINAGPGADGMAWANGG